MRLFDEQIRSYSGAPEYGEATFAFLNRSNSPQEGAIRERLESWFLRYPESNARNLRARLRSEDDQQHNAAFFELLLHELLLRFGCRVEVEAGGSSRTTKPDFLVRDPCGLKWYLEAVTASAKPSPTREVQQIINSLCDWLNERLPRRDYLLHVFYTGEPSGSLPRKPVLEFLLDRLGSCDYSTILGVSRTRGHAALPSWEYAWGACRIRFQLVPRKESARGNARVRVLGHPNLAQETLLGQMVDRMRDAISEKAGKYGRLEAPFVVAVNVPHWSVHPVDIMLALFGWDDVAYGFSVGPDLMKLGMPPPRGVWLEGASDHGKRYTRLSAVAFCSHLSPWNIDDNDLCLYNNPWAAYPYDSVLNCLPRCVTFRDGRSERVGGLSLAQILAD
jgi:hypothetical protein